MDIQIIEIKPVNQGNLRAFVKLQIGEIILNDFRIVQQAGQKAWVACPQTEWADKGGKKHYKPMVELPGTIKDQVQAAILQEWSGTGYGNYPTGH